MGITCTAVRQRDRQATDQMHGFIVAVGASLLLAVGILSAIPRRNPEPPTDLAGRVNPNTATVSSLARLPGIGLARASAIVAHRTRIREETGREAAFTCPADLEHVKGIGPQTAAKIAVWLDFDDSGLRGQNSGNDG